jgi:hypothetical protein
VILYFKGFITTLVVEVQEVQTSQVALELPRYDDHHTSTSTRRRLSPPMTLRTICLISEESLRGSQPVYKLSRTLPNASFTSQPICISSLKRCGSPSAHRAHHPPYCVRSCKSSQTSSIYRLDRYRVLMQVLSGSLDSSVCTAPQKLRRGATKDSRLCISYTTYITEKGN